MGKVGWIVVAMIVVLGVGCVIAATMDSCNRNNRACFGNSQGK